MNDILGFTLELSARPGYKKMFYKTEDAATLKSLDDQLMHAFQIFEVRV